MVDAIAGTADWDLVRVTGSYFVLMDLGFIRGDHINYGQDSQHIDPSQIHYPMAAVYERFPKAQAITLTSVTDTPLPD